MGFRECWRTVRLLAKEQLIKLWWRSRSTVSSMRQLSIFCHKLSDWQRQKPDFTKFMFARALTGIKCFVLNVFSIKKKLKITWCMLWWITPIKQVQIKQVSVLKPESDISQQLKKKKEILCLNNTERSEAVAGYTAGPSGTAGTGSAAKLPIVCHKNRESQLNEPTVESHKLAHLL